MKVKRDARKTRPYGPNIVRAWFDTVFCYALRGLENERGFLTQHNWTFRFRGLVLEHLGPIEELLPASAMANLSQFAHFFPEVDKAITEHDTGQGVLALDCRVFHKAILNHPRFREVFAAVAVEAPQQLGEQLQRYFGSYSSEEDFMGIIAEYLVNNLEELPGFYATADLWNHYRERFVRAIATPELAPLREDTFQSGQNLLEAAEQLNSLLKQVREELSLEFDVPIVTRITSDR